MSKFNEKENNRVENYMGEMAFKLPEKLELVSLLLTTFVENSYYESKEKSVGRLSDLVKNIKDKKFIAKAAIYARNVFGMRSITHIVAGEIAKNVKNEKWTKKFFDIVVHRVDDITEVLSYYLANYKKPIPNSLRKGLKTAFNRFDEYQLAKYKSENKEISLIDAVNLLHPIPNEKNKEALKKLIKNELKSFDTWESELTKAGQTAKTDKEKEEFKKDVWVKLIKERKIGYFALLRNLRNISEQASEVLNEALEMLKDEGLIKKSLILPFRFLSAYNVFDINNENEIKFEKNDNKKTAIINALNKALSVSINNLPLLNGKTAILSDNSGSMTGDAYNHSLLSKFTNTEKSDIANLFAVLYYMRCDNTFIGLFGDNLIAPKLDRGKNIFDNFKIIDEEKNKCGGATETGIFRFFESIIKEKQIIDRIIVFSDCQIGTDCKWYGHPENSDYFNELYKQYKKINPNCLVYSIDLSGCGTNVFSGDTFRLAGWSEKIFDIMKLLEQDKNALINEIEKIEI